MCDKMRGHEPTAPADEEVGSPLLPRLGVQGAFPTKGPRPDWAIMSEEELDSYAEIMYDRQLRVYEAMVAAERRPRPRRRFHDYTAKNCEEATGSGNATTVNVAAVFAGRAAGDRGHEPGP